MKSIVVTLSLASVMAMTACVNNPVAQDRKLVNEQARQERQEVTSAIRNRADDFQQVEIVGNTVVYTHIFDGIVDIKTYTYNEDTCVEADNTNNANCTGGKVAIKEIHVRRPTTTIFVLDRNTDGTDCSYVQGTGHLQYRHNGRLNIVMYDGHVKSFSEPELFENSDKYYGQLRYGFSWGCNYCNKGKY